ncbi:MAG: flagellar biosynthesis anti-sigma factor FlgM [Planctomycetota bacterium]
MSDISPVSRTYAPDYAPPTTAGKITEAAAVTRGRDEVSLSDSARVLAAAKENPIREDLVASVKAQIAEGTYETDAKLDAAVDAAFNDLA